MEFLFISDVFVQLFFTKQASLSNFKAAQAVTLWALNFVSSAICFPKYIRMSFILFHVCNLAF
jgi:hypothetical protein